MSEKKLYNVDDVLECANMAIALRKKNEEQESELARLKELNREMVEALKKVSKEYLEDKVYHSISYDTYMQISIALTKAEQVLAKAGGGEGE